MNDETIAKRWDDAPLAKEEIVFRRRHNARRYIARVDDGGRIVVTIPRGGSQRGAFEFARTHAQWLRDQRDLKLTALGGPVLRAGDWIWFRGERFQLSVSKDRGRPLLAFGSERVYIADENMDLSRPLAERLRRLAGEELSRKLKDLAEIFELPLGRVSIRDQRTRWGSCSTSGAISINWRIIMAPPQVAEYILIHELMHLKEMNHSPAFWALVEAAAPDYRLHEQWLRLHQSELSWGRE